MLMIEYLLIRKNKNGGCMIFDSAFNHARNIQSGQVSSLELTQSYFSQIDRHNPAVNAIVISNKEAALAQARQVDASSPSSSQSDQPLRGVPVTVKEAFAMRGMPLTVNTPQLKDYVPQEDSILVQRLYDAGAIVLGKTNVPLMLSDSQTFGPLYPTCNNPYDLSRTPGGSTGGGAAAVAAGMTTFEIGSDIGGSIRNPSHYCGLFGLKPTFNGHQQDGHVPPMPFNKTGFSAMNSTGPLARCMDDIELAYQVCYAPRWDYQKYLPIKTPGVPKSNLSEYRIAWFDEIHGMPCTEDTRQALARVVKHLEGLGAKVTRIQLDKQLTQRIYETWAALFGFVVGQDFNWAVRQLLKMKFMKDVSGSRLDVKKQLMRGLSLKFRHFSAALREQQECTAEFSRYFDDYDFVLSPCSAGPAFKHNPKHQPMQVNGEQLHYSDYCFAFVMPYNAMGNPVLCFPSGLNAEGLPIGLQLAAPHHQEAQLIHFGKLLEQEGYRFTPPEGY